MRPTKAEMLAWFGLDHDPFGQLQGAKDFWSTMDVSAAVHLLNYAARHHEAVAVLGEIGAGKTTIVHAALEHLDEAVRPIHFFADKERATIGQIVETCLRELSPESPPASDAARRRLLREMWIGLHKEERLPLLVIDEAHRLRGATVKALKELHEQSRYAYLSALFAVVYVGHRQLTALYQLGARDMLARLEAHNILVLGPLIPLQAKAYLRCRLTAAGGEDLIDPELLDNLAARGTPLDLNRRLWEALADAHLAGERQLTERALAAAGLLAPPPLPQAADVASRLERAIPETGGTDATEEPVAPARNADAG